MMLDQCIIGDCRDVMRQMIAAGVTVQTIVTSPPYWGLRDYGTATWRGGIAGCDHVEAYSSRTMPANSGGMANKRPDMEDRQTASDKGRRQFSAACDKCGARRVDRQLGLERTPTRYVARMRSIFRLAWELLADDGVMWLNLGDCYATGAGRVGDHPGGGEQGSRWRGDVDRLRDAKRGYRGDRLANGHSNTGAVLRKKSVGIGPMTQPNRMPIHGLKPKDLVGIPWRVAFALQADGWWLRNDIIWSKPNPMPESVTDRCTKSHEYIFMLTKSERYYFDADAIKEASTSGDARKPYAPGQVDARGDGHDRGGGKVRPSVARGGFNGKTEAMIDEGRNAFRAVVEWRNRRTVWTVPTSPFVGAHFAVFPEKLIEPCILAGSRTGDTVFDPFMGAGTVAAVATRLGRRWLGSELNATYVEMQKPRAAQQGLPLG